MRKLRFLALRFLVLVALPLFASVVSTSPLWDTKLPADGSSTSSTAEGIELPPPLVEQVTTDMPRQDDPFRGSFASSENPSLNQVAQITFSVNPEQDMPDTTIEFFLPPQVEVVAGNREWHGDLAKEQPFAVTMSVRVTDKIRQHIKAEARTYINGIKVSRSYYFLISTMGDAGPSSIVDPDGTSIVSGPLQSLPPGSSTPPGKSRQNAHTLSPGNITIIGTLEYVNDDGGYSPMRGVLVKFYDDDGGSDELLGSTYTEDDGDFSLTVANQPGEGGCDVYFRAYAENVAAKGTDDGGSQYVGVSGTRNDVPDGTVDFGTMSAPSSTNDAWQAVDASLTERRWIDSQVGWTRSQIQIKWPSGSWPMYSWTYNTSTGVITAQQMNLPDKATAGWDHVTVHHEYGHAVMIEAYGTNNSNLPPTGSYASHWITMESDQGFATREGWAEFMQAAVDNDPDNLQSWSQNIETNDWHNKQDSGDFDGDIIEGSFASILWDILDPANDDSLNMGFDEIWAIFIGDRPGSIHAIWNGWSTRGYGQMQGLSRIYYNYGVKKDNTAPVAVSGLHSTSHSAAVWSNDPTVDTAWTPATDDLSGVDGYSILWNHSPATLPDTTKDIGDVSSTTSPSLSNASDWYFHIRSVDYSGNWDDSAVHLGPFSIETVAPVTTKSIGSPHYVASGKSWVTSNTPFTLNATDTGGSGIATTYYRYWPTGTPPPGGTIYTTPFYISGTDGQYTVEYYSVDAAGNAEAIHSQTEWLDNTPPTTTKTVGTPQYTDGSGKLWVTSATSHTLSASDGSGSGVANRYYRYWPAGTPPPGGTTYTAPFYIIGADGQWIVEFRSADNLDNYEIVGSQIEWLDNTPPTTSPTVGSPQYADGSGNLWITSATPHTLTASDGSGSGVANIYYRYWRDGTSMPDWTAYTAPIYVNSHDGLDGRYQGQARAIDRLGNTEAIKYLIEWLDNTPPTTTKTVGSPQYTDGSGRLWITSATSHTLSASDGSGSGVANRYYRYWPSGTPPPGGTTYTAAFYISGTDGQYTVEFHSADNLGNYEAVRSQIEWLDNTPPTTTKTVGSPKYTDASGRLWITSAAPHTLTASDGPGSGVANRYYRYWPVGMPPPGGTTYTAPFYIIGPDGQWIVEFRSADNLGNYEIARSQIEWLDNTPPVSQVGSMLLYQLRAPFNVPYIAADGGSGVAVVELWYRYQPHTGAPWTGWTKHAGSLASFPAPNGNGVYQFYTIAIDNLGNREAPPPVADTTVRVVVTVPGRSVFFYDAGRGTGLWLDYQARRFQPFTTERAYPVKSGGSITEHDGTFSVSYSDANIRLTGAYKLSSDTASFNFFDKATPPAWQAYNLTDAPGFELPY